MVSINCQVKVPTSDHIIMDTLFTLLDVILNVIRFTSHGYNRGMMQNPVKDCIGHYWIKEDRLPVTKVDIGGYDRTFLLIPHIDQLEEQIGILFIDRKITKLINDQQLVLAEVL